MGGHPDILSDNYLRQRWNPRHGDPLYLHLSDLLLALEACKSTASLDVLDYGSGGSPYRGLFPNADYRSADIAATPHVDYVLRSDGRVPEDERKFDLVLSTQVLEHVSDFVVYLGECWRLLRPGGRLVLSTHGVFEDHGCPHDLWRWTADGLRAALSRTSFAVESVRKTTTNGRAIAFLLQQHRDRLSVSRRSAAGLGLWLLKRSLFADATRFHAWCDRTFQECRVVESGLSDHVIYIGLVAVATKRQD
jgi:SAM-dependent methyltransferase